MPETIQDEVARALGLYLANEGLPAAMCVVTAIHFMGMIQNALDADDLAIIKDKVREDAITYNKWVEQYHPGFKRKVVLE